MLFDFCTFGYYFWSSKYLKVSSEMLLIFGAAARSKWGGGESISATSTGHRQDSVLLFSFVTQGLKIKSESRHSHLLLNSRFNLNYGGICRRCWHWCKILQIMEATRWRFFNLSWVFFICQEFCGIPSLSPWWQRLWGLGVEPQHDKKGWIKELLVINVLLDTNLLHMSGYLTWERSPLQSSLVSGSHRGDVAYSTLVHRSGPFECLLRSCLKSKKKSEVTSYPQRTSRGLPHAFLSRSKGAQSNRISEHTEAPNTGNKESSLLSDEIGDRSFCGILTSSVLLFPILLI